jgi:nucleoside-diphosphate-sugar epimerase
MRVLVTGASGFLGGAACARLLADGHEVQALVRRPGSEPAGTTAVAGDFADHSSVATAIAAAEPDVVLHLAAEIASQRSEERIDAVNVAGTRALLDACTKAGSPRVVFTSTVVTGDAGGRVLSEEEPLPVTTPYGRSKQEGERMLAASGLPFVVIRPSHIYGPGGWYRDELIAQLRKPGRFCVIGRGDNLWDVVHVDDVVSALVFALESAPSGETYHCADDEPITYYEFMALSARTLGLGPPRRVPAALARLAAGRNAVDAVLRSARSSNAKLRATGWAPEYPTAATGVPAALRQLGD